MRKSFLMILACAIFGIARSASAGTPAPVEGRDYSVVPCPSGGDSNICLRVSRQAAYLDTRQIAKKFGTDIFSIRAENLFSTLALCHVPSRNVWRGLRSAASIQDRATNAFWTDCPEENQHLAFIPGELVRISGAAYLSPSEEHRVVQTVRACTTPECAVNAVERMTPKVDWTGVTILIDSPPPSPPVVRQPLRLMPPEKVPPPSWISEHRHGIAYAIMLSMIVALGIALWVSTRRLRIVRRESSAAIRLEREMSCAALRKAEQESAELRARIKDLENDRDGPYREVLDSILSIFSEEKTWRLSAQDYGQRIHGFIARMGHEAHGAIGRICKLVRGVGSSMPTSFVDFKEALSIESELSLHRLVLSEQAKHGGEHGDTSKQSLSDLATMLVSQLNASDVISKEIARLNEENEQLRASLLNLESRIADLESARQVSTRHTLRPSGYPVPPPAGIDQRSLTRRTLFHAIKEFVEECRDTITITLQHETEAGILFGLFRLLKNNIRAPILEGYATFKFSEVETDPSLFDSLRLAGVSFAETGGT